MERKSLPWNSHVLNFPEMLIIIITVLENLLKLDSNKLPDLQLKAIPFNYVVKSRNRVSLEIFHFHHLWLGQKFSIKTQDFCFCFENIFPAVEFSNLRIERLNASNVWKCSKIQ